MCSCGGVRHVSQHVQILIYGVSATVVMCRLVGHERLSGWWVRMLPISYALFSGMLGTQSVLFCKMLSMLLRTTIQGDSQLGSWFTWVIFILFLGTAFFWVSRLNKVCAPYSFTACGHACALAALFLERQSSTIPANARQEPEGLRYSVGEHGLRSS
jgi:hypothetical protein